MNELHGRGLAGANGDAPVRSGPNGKTDKTLDDVFSRPPLLAALSVHPSPHVQQQTINLEQPSTSVPMFSQYQHDVRTLQQHFPVSLPNQNQMQSNISTSDFPLVTFTNSNHTLSSNVSSWTPTHLDSNSSSNSMLHAAKAHYYGLKCVQFGTKLDH
jgi:hypothetical protein